MSAIRRVLPILLSLVLLLPASGASAASARGCTVGQSPSYRYGFAALNAQLGPVMGNAESCEYADPNGTGDTLQDTAAGLAFWRKSTNTPTFTNGADHWGITARGFVQWAGSNIDPPGTVATLNSPPLQPATPPPPQPILPPQPIIPAGPPVDGVDPTDCGTGTWENTGIPIYVCQYPNDAVTVWKVQRPPWVLLVFGPPGGSLGYTDAGNALLRPTTSPPVAATSVSFVSVTGGKPGGTARVTVQTAPSASCSIDYTTPNGTASRAQGLYPQSADATGLVTWAWMIGSNTYSGTGTVRVVCNGISQTAPITIGGVDPPIPPSGPRIEGGDLIVPPGQCVEQIWVDPVTQQKHDDFVGTGCPPQLSR